MMDEPPSKAAEVKSNYELVAVRLLCRSRPRTVVFSVPSWLPGPDPPLGIHTDDKPWPPHPYGSYY